MNRGKVVVKKDLLSEDNITELIERVNNFTPTEVPNSTGLSYYREHIDKDGYEEFTNKIHSIIKEEFDNKPLKLARIVINRVDGSYNENDPFHRDLSLMSSVTLLNSDYKGGEFNYIDSDSKDVKLKVDQFNTIIFNGNTTKHRILPVTEGARYSFVTFWKHKININKGIL